MLEQDHSHNPEDIQARLSQGPGKQYIKEWVYGGVDGVVTTFAIVAGVTGANLSPFIVLILGIANLVGDGFSMAAGAFSSSKAETDNYHRLRAVEINHIKKYPEGEREEIRQIYAAKGFSGEDLEKIVTTITSDKDRWVDAMMTEEYGLSLVQDVPIKAAIHTFIAFIICGAMPLIPFLLSFPYAFYTALVLSAVTFFIIGSFKSQWSVTCWWILGLETMSIGLTAAGIAFIIGFWLRGLGI